jgi:hypothetical protein
MDFMAQGISGTGHPATAKELLSPDAETGKPLA